jgi:hypothetical protein
MSESITLSNEEVKDLSVIYKISAILKGFKRFDVFKNSEFEVDNKYQLELVMEAVSKIKAVVDNINAAKEPNNKEEA